VRVCAEALSVAPPTSSRTVDFVSLGLLARTLSESDHPKAQSTLTEEGRAALSRLGDARREVLAAVKNQSEREPPRPTVLFWSLRAGSDRWGASDGR
jgi:hypothetical protein